MLLRLSETQQYEALRSSCQKVLTSDEVQQCSNLLEQYDLIRNVRKFLLRMKYRTTPFSKDLWPLFLLTEHCSLSSSLFMCGAIPSNAANGIRV